MLNRSSWRIKFKAQTVFSWREGDWVVSCAPATWGGFVISGGFTFGMPLVYGKSPFEHRNLARCFQGLRGANAIFMPCIVYKLYIALVLTEIHYHRRMRSFLRRKHYRISTWLGMFGAASPKPLKLWCSGKFVTKLKRTAIVWLSMFWAVLNKQNNL